MNQLGIIQTLDLLSQMVRPDTDSKHTLSREVKVDAGGNNCCGCCLSITPTSPTITRKPGQLSWEGQFIP